MTTIRITAWAPRRQTGPTTYETDPGEASALAALVKAVLLNSGSAATWRFRPGAGLAPGVDPNIKLPFCTFTLTAETRGTAVA